MPFNVLPLGNNKAILGMPQLQEYNLRINWIIGQVNIRDTRRRIRRNATKIVQYQVGVTYEETKRDLSYILKRFYKYKKLWNK